MDPLEPPEEPAGTASPGPRAPATGPRARRDADGAVPRHSVPVRRVPDRRTRPTPRFSRYTLFGGRRRQVRRGDELAGSFVDLYDARLLALIGWVALMNVLDSFFTLYHLQAGGSEVNPIAAAMLRSGRVSFVVAKSGLISLALLVLCVHKNFRLARLGLLVSTVVYTVLVAYHLLLFGHH